MSNSKPTFLFRKPLPENEAQRMSHIQYDQNMILYRVSTIRITEVEITISLLNKFYVHGDKHNMLPTSSLKAQLSIDYLNQMIQI